MAEQPTHVGVVPSNLAAEAATMGSRALIDAGVRRLDRGTVLAELRLQVLAARWGRAHVLVLKRTLLGQGWAAADIDAAIDPADPVMSELWAAADTPTQVVHLEVRTPDTGSADSTDNPTNQSRR